MAGNDLTGEASAANSTHTCQATGRPPATRPTADLRSRHATRRFVHGVLGNIFSQVINVLGQLVLVPLFLLWWGKQLYGEWLVLSAAVAYAVLLDFGMQTYVVNRLNQCYARGELREYRRILHSALLWSLLVSSAGLLLLIPSLAMLPVNRWFQLVLTGRSATTLICVLLAVQILGAIPLGVLGGVYRSVGEYARSVAIGNVHRLIQFGLTALVVLAGGELRAVAASNVLILLVVIIYVCFDLKRRYPEIGLGLADAEIKLAASFLAPSALFFLIQSTTAITLQGTTLIVSGTLGAGMVAVFVTLRTLSNLTRQLTNAIYSTLWPELTAMSAKNESDKLRKVYLLSSKLLLGISVTAALFLHYCGQDIIRLWTRQRVTYDGSLMDAFLLLLITQSWWMSSSLLLSSSNNHRLLSICQFVGGCLGMGIGYLLSHHFGATGIVCGLWIADVVFCTLPIPALACRMIGQKFWQFGTEVILRGVPVVLATGVTLDWISRTLAREPTFRVALSGATAFACAGLLGYWTWLTPVEQDQAGLFISRLTSKEGNAK
jgi:O-antigen/teichoic acid export membrane protein